MVAKRKVLPTDLPSDPFQCIHMEYVYDDKVDESYPERCMLNANPTGTGNGWLCDEHNDLISHSGRLRTRVKSPNRDKDKEVVTNIINHENRALEVANRVKVRLTCKGEGLTYDEPLSYAQQVIQARREELACAT